MSARLSRVLAGAAAAVLVAVVVAAVVLHAVTGRFWQDLAVLRAGAAIAGGGDGEVYRVAFTSGGGVEYGFTYPPFSALLLQPLAHLGMTAAVGLWTLASVLALLAAVWATLRAGGLPAGRRAVPALLATAASLPMLAVSGHLQTGQAGVFLMALVLLDLTGDPRRRWYGLATGIAAGIKLTPLIFVAYLLVTRRFRAAATAAGGFLGTVAVGFVWRPEDSHWFWGGGLFAASRVTEDPRTILNQSLRGALARVLDSGDPGLAWLLLAGAVGVAGLVAAARARDPLLGLFSCAVTGLLVSPVSWHHHWVWVVPVLTLAAVRRRDVRGRAAVGVVWLVFVASTTWVLAGLQGWDLHFGGWGLIYSNLYVLAGLVFLALPHRVKGEAESHQEKGVPAGQ
ncbi:glycosyltransferase 87 family protein [Nonomuraea typhae]|uniref:glycosyltransferase 87 family protein n=1 Tax=Nonomuraea typhae TaxID=2603600 RepID=UPI001FE86E2A|nr:glycosyltransferase 87 family protein [Nonomuraea typhae]